MELIDNANGHCFTYEMSNDLNSQHDSPERRIFASKYSHQGWGWTLTVLGVLGIVGGDPSAGAGGYIFSGLMILLGVFLLRGKGLSPAQEAKKQKRDALADENLDKAVSTLQAATGGAALVAYRNLEATLKKLHKAEVPEKLNDILTSINFDRSRLQSTPIGNVRTIKVRTILGDTISGDTVEVFHDWIIYGQVAYDVDATTRGEVHVDGSLGLDAKGNTKDFRTAELQFVSKSWSMTAPITPNDANDARRIASQLSLVTDALKPSVATTADIATMVQAILTNTGQPPAERIEQLNVLRYQHLLSDEEFEAAKTKVLGI